MPVTESLPVVSILIAARNEEASILNCLRAIDLLHYVPGTVEVLIGNDQSTDQTRQLISDFISDKPTYHLIDVTSTLRGLQGKANVLAQLAHRARGQLLFFTDADTQVPTDWLTEMSRQLTAQTGIVTGITLPEGFGILSRLQTIDWLYNLTLTHIISSLGIPVTAMGNNMAVSRVAYKAVGGYESLPFSVVEDYTLFKSIVSKGYNFRNLLNPNVLASTEPVTSVQALFRQRKRWMRGAMQLPFWMVLSLLGQYLIAPLLFLIGWFAPGLAIGLYLARLLLQTTVISYSLSRLDRTSLLPYALLFDIYQLIFGPLAVIYYVLPTAIEWKGRSYK
ncbi:hypothetical protein GCM10028807_17200 [Spirosoma daeguense]